MGIPHIEDLDVNVFIDTMRKLSNNGDSIETSIKFDGSANLGLGIDDKGNLFFDRSVKGQSDLKRGPNDWPKKPYNNAIRSAIAAILSKKNKFEELLNPGDYTDCEVMFEAIPNAIEYGDNYIIFHDAKYNNLVKKIGLLSAKIDLYLYDENSKKIKKSIEKVTYKLGGKEIVDSKKYKFSINNEIEELEKFISKNNKVFPNLTNLEVIALRAAGNSKKVIKDEKNRIFQRIKDYKLGIKDKVIDQFLNKLPSSVIAPPPVFDEKGNNVGGSWPEGIVIKDLQTGDLSKIVSVFPIINKFLWYYREMASKGSGPAGNFIPGVMSNFKKDIAKDVFGIPVLSSVSPTAHIKKSYPIVATNKKLLFFLKDKKFNFNKSSTSKSNFIKAINSALKSLENLKDEFEKEGIGRVLNVNKGTFSRKVKYSDVHIRKTYETFIEVRNELISMKNRVLKVNSKTKEGLAVQLLRIFLGQNNLKKLNEEENVNIIKNRILFEDSRDYSVGVILGRYQPPTRAHFNLIKKSSVENDITLVFIAGQKVDKSNPFDFKLRKKIIESKNKKVKVFPAKVGFIPDLIQNSFSLNRVSEINIYAGSDRIQEYKRQFSKYWDEDDITININEIKRDPDKSISGTKVRSFIINDDFSSFEKSMSDDFSKEEKIKLFKLFKSKIL